MSAFAHRDLHRVARVVAALSSGVEITLPEIEQRRGQFMTEAFRRGPDRVDGTPCLQARTTFRRGNDGRVSTAPWDALDWTVGDLLAMTAWWPDETVEALPERTVDGPGVLALLALDATGKATIAGKRYALRIREASAEQPWTIDVVEIDCSGRWGADELVGLETGR